MHTSFSLLFLLLLSTTSLAHDFDDYFETVLNITKEAGEIIKQKIWEVKNVKTKHSVVDFVTETDKEIEEKMKSEISSKFADHKFIGEEATDSGQKMEFTDAPTWIIDPIDGTMNFVHGYPYVCISVALFVNKETQIGIIYNPVLDQLFTARKGQGAFYNNKPMTVSAIKAAIDDNIGFPKILRLKVKLPPLGCNHSGFGARLASHEQRICATPSLTLLTEEAYDALSFSYLTGILIIPVATISSEEAFRHLRSSLLGSFE
ncbi:Inositol monophosphatase 2 [Homalodisca vitripennis]|nr:Inositol monophosphatase 2 [Homalodisca vitripennis]